MTLTVALLSGEALASLLCDDSRMILHKQGFARDFQSFKVEHYFVHIL